MVLVVWSQRKLEAHMSLLKWLLQNHEAPISPRLPRIRGATDREDQEVTWARGRFRDLQNCHYKMLSKKKSISEKMKRSK